MKTLHIILEIIQVTAKALLPFVIIFLIGGAIAGYRDYKKFSD